MEKTYFIAVDKPCGYLGHENYSSDYLTINRDKVDIHWRSWGVKGNASNFLGKKDRGDRQGFIWYKKPPRKEEDRFTAIKSAMGENEDIVTLRNPRIGYFSLYEEEPYNIWTEEEGRDYIIFSVDGKNLRTKDLEDKVDLIYYAGKEDAHIKPIWEKLVSRTRLFPTDMIHSAHRQKPLIEKCYELSNESFCLPFEAAFSKFAHSSTMSNKAYEQYIKDDIKDSVALQEVLRRERKEKNGLFKKARTISGIVPFYTIESLELGEDHTLCAVVRQPVEEWDVFK